MPSNELYDIPSDPEARKKLLEELLSGAKTLESLEQDSVSIQLNLHPSDQERVEFSQHMTDQDNLQSDGSTVYFTVSMPAFTRTPIDPAYLEALATPPISDTRPAPANQPINQPAPNQVSDSYWDFGGSGRDRTDAVAGHLRNLRNP